MLYRLLVGENQSNGSLKTILVHSDVYESEGKDPGMFFINPDDFDIKDYGELEITGESEHMLPDVMEDM